MRAVIAPATDPEAATRAVGAAFVRILERAIPGTRWEVLPNILTTAEAARMLRIRESTLRDHTRRGVIPHFHIGRLVRYHAADLAAWLETIKQTPQASPAGPPANG